MDGSEKLPLLMIGKSSNPRCFKNVKSKPVEYQAIKKAWMTGEIFKNWLLKIDKIFCKQNRKVMLFIDNCTAHNYIPTMGNLEVLFFPPNMTSVVQPMDQGIIKNFKHHYRTLLVLNLLQDGGKIDILQANRMSKNAWEQVTSETIANCFRKAGFLSGNSENVGDEEIQQTITINVWDDVRQGVNINFDDYINMDDDLEVCGHLSDSDIIELTVRCTQSSDEEDEQECIEPPHSHEYT